MTELNDKDAEIYMKSHLEALLAVGSAIGPILNRGEPAKLAVKRALCEQLAALVAAGNGITFESDFQSGEAARAAYDGILSWCAKEKGLVR